MTARAVTIPRTRCPTSVAVAGATSGNEQASNEIALPLLCVLHCRVYRRVPGPNTSIMKERGSSPSLLHIIYRHQSLTDRARGTPTQAVLFVHTHLSQARQFFFAMVKKFFGIVKIFIHHSKHRISHNRQGTPAPLAPSYPLEKPKSWHNMLTCRKKSVTLPRFARRTTKRARTTRITRIFTRETTQNHTQ